MLETQKDKNNRRGRKVTYKHKMNEGSRQTETQKERWRELEKRIKTKKETYGT